MEPYLAIKLSEFWNSLILLHACDVARILRLSQVYGLKPQGHVVNKALYRSLVILLLATTRLRSRDCSGQG